MERALPPIMEQEAHMLNHTHNPRRGVEHSAPFQVTSLKAQLRPITDGMRALGDRMERLERSRERSPPGAARRAEDDERGAGASPKEKTGTVA